MSCEESVSKPAFVRATQLDTQAESKNVEVDGYSKRAVRP